jgi:hypothetical protein
VVTGPFIFLDNGYCQVFRIADETFDSMSIYTDPKYRLWRAPQTTPRTHRGVNNNQENDAFYSEDFKEDTDPQSAISVRPICYKIRTTMAPVACFDGGSSVRHRSAKSVFYAAREQRMRPLEASSLGG